MSDGMSDRERGFEAKWAHDEEMLFKIMAGRDRLLASWAANVLALSGDEKEKYINGIVKMGMLRHAGDPVPTAIRNDLHSRGIEMSSDDLASIVSACGEQAEKEIKT